MTNLRTVRHKDVARMVMKDCDGGRVHLQRANNQKLPGVVNGMYNPVDPPPVGSCGVPAAASSI